MARKTATTVHFTGTAVHGHGSRGHRASVGKEALYQASTYRNAVEVVLRVRQCIRTLLRHGYVAVLVHEHCNGTRKLVHTTQLV